MDMNIVYLERTRQCGHFGRIAILRATNRQRVIVLQENRIPKCDSAYFRAFSLMNVDLRQSFITEAVRIVVLDCSVI